MPRAGCSDFGFDIHVDPSCLSTPMEDHTSASQDDSYRAEAATPATDGTSHQHEKASLVASLPQQSQHDSFDMSAHDQSIDTADFADHDNRSSDVQAAGDRRVSGRTDALIHAAAQAVVDQIERNRHGETEEEHSVLSSHVNDNDTVEGTEVSYVTETDGDRRDSRDSRNSRGLLRLGIAGQPPRHDRSARSSLGSFEGSLHNGMKNLKRSQHVDDEDETRTEHSRISDFSHYDPREFQPTLRSTPRPAFHSTSDVRALQLSSPAPSVFGGSPRSSKRPHMPTISRLGSPSMSAQYSPKGRTTPSRLKPRKTTPPLVLLHATLLPLRWPWADVLEAAPSDVLSPEAKTLRDYWRRLHDRLDDTVCDRGVLLPHPQNDFEVLEERLLDALDLPLRRRARILECGHYLGPSNEATLTEDLDSDEEDEPEEDRSRQSSSLLRKSLHEQTHWCTICHHEIKFEPLGPGKIFRVKVYASNGLMKAGAWDACWKEMERVDVEIEPIIEGGVLDELERLAIEQREAAEAAEREADEAAEAEAAEAALIESSMMENDYNEHAALPALAMASPLPAISPAEPTPLSSDTVSRHDQLEERRFRDEARMREIYGDTPQPTISHAGSSEPTPDSYIPGPTPVSPSEEARARREARREAAPPPLQNASLPELLLEAARVMLQDRKNVALVLLTLLVLFLAVKPPVRDDMRMYDWESKIPHNDAGMPEVVEIKTVAAAPAVQPVVEPAVQPVVEPADASSSAVVEPNTAHDPCQTPSAAVAADVRPEAGVPVDEAVTSRKVVRVVETVTETETVKAFVTEEAPSPSTIPTEAAQPASEGEQVQLEHEDASGSSSVGEAPAASVVNDEDNAEPQLVLEEVIASSIVPEPEAEAEAETGSADDAVEQQRKEEQHGEQDKQEL
ncbi:hypothetical protein HYQ44_019799 [Verticillium longisporum]|nr:hypothetical protein HYQ44_019799 [Verticillium longisporum]